METESLTNEFIDTIKPLSQQFQLLKNEIGRIVVGNEDAITFSLIALLCNGHILLEGVPGVAKTTMIKTISQALGLFFKRIQFTPDLLPADLIGTLIFNPKTHEFETKKGPIFAHFILADEINRTPAKVQAALLEAMQEKQVTIGSETFELEKPFLVFATQNPIEQEGTYRLPEAQVDRFMFKVLIEYLTMDQEREILIKNKFDQPISQIFSHDQIIAAQNSAKKIYVDEKIINYIVNIVFATRQPSLFNLKNMAPFINYGVSPRATLALYAASQALALLKGRHFVIPDDVKKVAPAIMRHRISLTYEAEADGVTSEHIINTILTTIPAP